LGIRQEDDFIAPADKSLDAAKGGEPAVKHQRDGLTLDSNDGWVLLDVSIKTSGKGLFGSQGRDHKSRTLEEFSSFHRHSVLSQPAMLIIYRSLVNLSLEAYLPITSVLDKKKKGACHEAVCFYTVRKLEFFHERASGIFHSRAIAPRSSHPLGSLSPLDQRADVGRARWGSGNEHYADW
jgi:hypothetical protein